MINKKLIKSQRKLLGLTQNDVAVAAGVTQPVIHNLEMFGRCGLETLVKVCQILHLEISAVIVVPNEVVKVHIPAKQNFLKETR